MKCFVLFILCLFTQIHLVAQSQYDYMDDDAVVGGVDRVFNVFVILFLIFLAAVLVLFILGGISKIMYEFSPQKELDRQKKEKEEREKQERIRKEEEHKKAILALPENTIHIIIEGKPHIVELAPSSSRRHPEMLAICLWTVDSIFWENIHITSMVNFVDSSFSCHYYNHYKSKWDQFSRLDELSISEYSLELAKKTKITSFKLELTIKGDFDVQKLQIIHHTIFSLYGNIRRDINCIEFVLYDGDVIQTHLLNGKPLCFPLEGYKSYPSFS